MMMQPISLTREFRPYPQIADIEDLVRQHYHQSEDLTWDQLCGPVVVILGAPGIGKTTEFRLRASVLNKQTFALFVPLCQIDADGWNLDSYEEERLSSWEADGNAKGVFLFDSIDEARLSDPQDFRKALIKLSKRLKPHFHRVQIFLSSRFYDWAVQDVRDAVHANVTSPLFLAQQRVKQTSDSATGNAPAPIAAKEVEPLVLMPLSQTERQKLALHYEVKNEQEFWKAVHEGDYLDMAVQPLDLEGLVVYWNTNQKLSNYAALMQAHVQRRLLERNPTYEDRGVALAPEKLYTGAEAIAMAMEVSSVKQIDTREVADSESLSVLHVLTNWQPKETRRLLGSAAFGFSSFQRFSFTNRSAREYLFGRWVVKRREGGVPLERLTRLFTRKQYGKSVLIPARRYGLSWACSLDHEFRRWAATNHPEIFVFDGDSSRWDTSTAEFAFKAYLTKLSLGWQSDWLNSPAEKRRVCAVMRPGFLPSMLAHFSSDDAACSTVLSYVYHAEVKECAVEVQNILDRSPPTTFRYRQAVAALGRVGSSAQLNALKAKLMGGEFFQKNEVIAEILEALGLGNFSLAELVYVFTHTGTEERFGGGAMARTLKHMLREECEFELVQMVMQALLECLPARACLPVQVGNLSEQPVDGREWICGVLAEIFERTIELLPSDTTELTVCVAAAHRVWALRHSDYRGVDDVKKMKALVSERATLRWRLLEEIAQSDSERNRSSLFHDFSIVGLEQTDFDEVVSRANDRNLGEVFNDVWFKLGVRLVIGYFDDELQPTALRRLIVSPYKKSRSYYIKQVQQDEQKRAAERKSEHQLYLQDEVSEKVEESRKMAHEVELISHDLPSIANAEFNLLLKATRYIQYHVRGSYFAKIDLSEVAQKFSKEIAAALSTGLVKHFKQCSVEDPLGYPDGSVPWSVLLATAGAQILVDQGGELDKHEIGKVAQLDVWNPNKPSSTFEAIYVGNELVIADALEQWLLAEASIGASSKGPHSTIRFLLSAPLTVQYPLLVKLKNANVPKGVLHPTQRKGIWDAMAMHGILSMRELAEIARRCVINADEKNHEAEMKFGWLRRWIYSSPATAWSWFKAGVTTSSDAGETLIAQFAENIGSLDSNLAFAGDERVRVLVEIYALLRPHAKQSEETSYFDRSTVESLVARIPSMVRKETGAIANGALADLAALEPNEITQRWLLSEQLHHASQNAEVEAITSYDQVVKLIDGFETEAASADQLLEQVWARLEEIKRGVEEGPFSDRNLFKATMDEKDIQLWLAARLSERVPVARFNVQREEEVDDYKKTDIQLSTGNKYVVCIEIKPLDSGKRYSAAKLVATLRDQLLGQYLKGNNSAHGILVLFLLTKRKLGWQIAGERNKSFEELLVYLTDQASAIMAQHNQKAGGTPVRALRIFDIKCYR
jgi:hypothetical protein